MERRVLDPFGDYATAGYLQNIHAERDLDVVGHLETATFEENILKTVRHLRRVPALEYSDVLDTHRRLFSSLYPWAGQDRSLTAPDIAIGKGGYSNLFAHPADCQRAANHALRLGQDSTRLRSHPGEVFGYLAHAHPFLDGNGRTILTIFADLSRRAGFYIEWESIEKHSFLQALTQELEHPGQGFLDRLIQPYLHEGVLSAAITARRLRVKFSTE